MTLGWPENFIKMIEMAEMVNVIKDTVDIYCFYKSWHETAQEHLLFKLPPVSLNWEVPALVFKTVEISLIQNHEPLGSENVQILGGRLGWWSGLELTDTLSSSGNNRLIPLTYWWANCVDLFRNQPWPGLVTEVDWGRGGGGGQLQ